MRGARPLATAPGIVVSARHDVAQNRAHAAGAERGSLDAREYFTRALPLQCASLVLQYRAVEIAPFVPRFKASNFSHAPALSRTISALRMHLWAAPDNS